MFIDSYSKIFDGVDEQRRQFEENENKELEQKREKEIAEREKLKHVRASSC